MTSRAAATSRAIAIAIAFAFALMSAGGGGETTTIGAGGDGASNGAAPTNAPGQTNGPEELSAAIGPFDEDNVPTTTTAPPLPAGEQTSPTATILDPDSPVTAFAVDDGDDAGQDAEPAYTGS